MTAQFRHRLLSFLGLDDPGHPYIVCAHRLRRQILRSDERLAHYYLQTTINPRLHVGGGWHRLDGWLNTDLELIPGVIRMDATRRFPFEERTFQYVFTEHMIEHVPYESGVLMLRECYRVMRKNGIIRVVTPDLAAITALHQCDLSPDQKEYLLWFCQTFVPPGRPHNSASAINAMFRLWGHQFLYDQETLAGSLRAAGFSSVTRWPLGESNDSDLQNLENQERYPRRLLNFESMALEAVKT